MTRSEQAILRILDKQDAKFLHADNEDIDQTVRMRTCLKVRNLAKRLKYISIL